MYRNGGILSFPGEQRLQKVLHLRQHHQGVPDAQLTGQVQLPPEGPGVVKEDEVGPALPAHVGEVAGAQLRREEYGAAAPQLCQLLRCQGRTGAVGRGEGEVHPHAGQIQCQTPGLEAAAGVPQPLAELCRREGIVLATGGGAVLRRESRRLLRDGGLVIFLDRSPWAIRRTLRRQGRPLLTDDGAIFRLARQRRDLYRAAAHHSVNKPTARQAAEEAVRLWREEQQ